jgi:hypothetical protein
MDAEISRTQGPMSNQDAIQELEDLIETIKLDRATVTQINVKKQYIGIANRPGILKEIEIKFATW